MYFELKLMLCKIQCLFDSNFGAFCRLAINQLINDTNIINPNFIPETVELDNCIRKVTDQLYSLLILLIYHISSNNSQGRLFLFSQQKGAIIRGKAIIQGRRLFQIIFLTRGHALNILLFSPSNKGKSEIHEYYHRKKTVQRTGAL